MKPGEDIVMDAATWAATNDVAAMIFFLTKQRIPTNRGDYQSGWIVQDLLDPKATGAQLRNWESACRRIAWKRAYVAETDDLQQSVAYWSGADKKPSIRPSVRAAILRDVVNPFLDIETKTRCLKCGSKRTKCEYTICLDCGGDVGEVLPAWATSPTVVALAEIAEEAPSSVCNRCDGLGRIPPRISVECNGCHGAGIISTGHLDPHRLDVLADALEEAGCENADILGHLRSPGPHYVGCWAVSLLSGNQSV